jgi:hypothetical protein
MISDMNLKPEQQLVTSKGNTQRETSAPSFPASNASFGSCLNSAGRSATTSEGTYLPVNTRSAAAAASVLRRIADDDVIGRVGHICKHVALQKFNTVLGGVR